MIIHCFPGVYMGVSKNTGTPKWMVKIMENPIKMDDLGGFPPIFGVDTHMYYIHPEAVPVRSPVPTRNPKVDSVELCQNWGTQFFFPRFDSKLRILRKFQTKKK